MKYMLDTNVLIHIMKRKNVGVIRKFLEHDNTEFCVSSITYAELCHGVSKSACRERNELALTLIMSSIEIIPFGSDAARAYGVVRDRLEKSGTPIGPMDTLIASHALSLGLTLITNNMREFERVEGLNAEDRVS